jgi:hypothetical protein
MGFHFWRRDFIFVMWDSMYFDSGIQFWQWDSIGILPVRRTPVCRTTFRRTTFCQKPNSNVSPKDRFLKRRLAEQSSPNAWSVAWLG